MHAWKQAPDSHSELLSHSRQEPLSVQIAALQNALSPGSPQPTHTWSRQYGADALVHISSDSQLMVAASVAASTTPPPSISPPTEPPPLLPHPTRAVIQTAQRTTHRIPWDGCQTGKVLVTR